MEAQVITPSESKIVPMSNLSLEAQLTVAGQQTISEAKGMSISTQQEYDLAAEALRKIKDQIKKVKQYWEEPKAKAKAAHQGIVEKEKAMLKTLNEAEAIIKGSMRTYLEAVEKARREAEAEAHRRQEEEAARLLEQAVTAEESGDDQAAAVSMAMAEMVSDMAAPPAIETPKATGISTRKVWKARITDPQKVPAYANGMELRTINMSALNSIARMTKGSASIPGVEFFEETSIAARS